MTDQEIYDKLKHNKHLILTVKLQVTQPPAPNKKCPCNSKKNYKKCGCAHADMARTKEFVEAFETKKKNPSTQSATTYICV